MSPSNKSPIRVINRSYMKETTHTNPEWIQPFTRVFPDPAGPVNVTFTAEFKGPEHTDRYKVVIDSHLGPLKFFVSPQLTVVGWFDEDHDNETTWEYIQDHPRFMRWAGEQIDNHFD